MIELGEYCDLEVLRDTPHGLFLGIEGEKDSVLLPGIEITDDLKVGDQLRVFVYSDSEDRPVATLKTPGITRNTFGSLKVRDINKMGVFLDWGLDKDLLVPFKEQYKRMSVDQKVLVFMYLDEDSERLVASANLDRFVSNNILTVKEEDEVELIVWDKSDLGYSVVVNNKHKGLLFENEVFRQLSAGDTLKGYVKQIREDNKLDIKLTKKGEVQIADDATQLLDLIKENEDVLPLGDKSSPVAIYTQCKMSKKAFKRAAGSLYKQGLIKIDADSLTLIKIPSKD